MSKSPLLVSIGMAYVMRSSKMSLNSEKTHTQFSYALYASTTELYHTENPIKIKYTFPELAIFSDAQNSKIQRKLNAIFGSI